MLGLTTVPVQFFQSIIAIELAVVGALLFQIRFFEESRSGENKTDPRVLVMFAVVLSATLFGSLASILHEAGTLAASAATIGLALSMVPILLRVLPPLTGRRADSRGAATTGAGLLLYLLVVASVVAILNT